jgi:hypothetical protein
MFTGNFPTGSYVEVKEDMVFGVHWENFKGSSVDLDLSNIDMEGKIGWDAQYRNNERTVMFSGDMTDARKPKGATELFYIGKSYRGNLITMLNFYNACSFKEAISYKIIVASEKVKNFRQNYMLDPNNIVAICNAEIDPNKKQTIIGLVIVNEDGCRFYFCETSMGRLRTVRNTEPVNQARRYLFNYFTNIVSLNSVLSIAGANVITEPVVMSTPELEGMSVAIDSIPIDIDLSPEILEKDTIIKLLTGL